MTEDKLVRICANWGVPGTTGYGHGGVLVSISDAVKAQADVWLFGNVFLRATERFDDVTNECVYERLDPTTVRIAT